MTMSMDYAYLEECRRRENARPVLERAREAANKSIDQCDNDIIRGRAQVLLALAQIEALNRIASALERGLVP